MLELSTAQRTPPHNIEAEKCVLGACLLDSNLIAYITEILEGSRDFYRETHQSIFQVMLDLFDRGEVIDSIILADELSRLGKLEEMGGMDYLQELMDLVPVAGNAEYYARIVKEKALRRSLISAGTVIAGLGFDEEQTVDEEVDKAEEMVFAIAHKKMIREDFSSVKGILQETFEHLEELAERKTRITGLATGFKDLDSLTGGLQPSNLIIIAARPGLGKTSLCLNIASNVAKKEKKAVAVFSLEMSKQEVGQRLLCSEAEVDASHARRGHFPDHAWPKLIEAMNSLTDLPIYIDDSASPTVLEIRSKARRLKSRAGIELLIIDYLQLIRGTGKSENRNQEISEISRRLKALSKELNIPVIAVSQLSREVEKRADKRPQLSDLRESGAIEQEADLVIFVYRSEDIEELIISKHRNGPVGRVQVIFLKEYTKFNDVTSKYKEPD